MSPDRDAGPTRTMLRDHLDHLLRLDPPTCPACGAAVGPDDLYCAACGTALEAGHPSAGRPLVPVAALFTLLALVNWVWTGPASLLGAFFGAGAASLWVLLLDDISYAEAARWLTGAVVAYGLLVTTDFLPPDVLASGLGEALFVVEVGVLGAALAGGLAFFRGRPPEAEVPEERHLLWAVLAAPAPWLLLDLAFSLDLWNILLMGLAGAGAYGVWSLAGLGVARQTLLRPVRRPSQPLVRLSAEGPEVPRADPRSVLALALVPLFFAYAVAAWALPFTATEGLQQADVAIDTAWIVLAVASVLMVPGKWLLDLLEVRYLDPETGAVEPAGLPVVLDEFVGISAALSIVAIAVSAGAALGLEPLGSALFVMGRTLFFLLPPAFAATFLYVRDVLPHDLALVLEEADFVATDDVRGLLADEVA